MLRSLVRTSVISSLGNKHPSYEIRVLDKQPQNRHLTLAIVVTSRIGRII